MNLFQTLTLPLFAVALVIDLVGLMRRCSGRRLRLVRVTILLAAAVAIVYPTFPQAIANQIGIGRGADLVLYLFVLAFLGASFYFYSRYLRLQGQLTDVVRYLAIQNARQGQQSDLV